MLRLAKIIKPWSEAGSLNANINLYGFWDETTFLTKSGDLGMVLKVRGVDFESLDQAGQEFAVKRLEAALKSFGPGFHIYQYLFKTNRSEMPFARYGDPLIDAAIDQRREFFESKIGAAGFGQQRRIAVVFHRLIMPDGYSVDLDQFQGLDQIGEDGLKDKVNSTATRSSNNTS